jgi:hypothetical protein
LKKGVSSCIKAYNKRPPVQPPIAGGYGPLCGFDAVYTDRTKHPEKAERLQQNCRLPTYAKGAGTKKALWEWINHLHRAFLLFLPNFSASAGRAAAAEDGWLGAWRSSGDKRFDKTACCQNINIYIFTLLVNRYFVSKAYSEMENQT